MPDIGARTVTPTVATMTPRTQPLEHTGLCELGPQILNLLFSQSQVTKERGKWKSR